MKMAADDSWDAEFQEGELAWDWTALGARWQTGFGARRQMALRRRMGMAAEVDRGVPEAAAHRRQGELLRAGRRSGRSFGMCGAGAE